MKFESHLNHVLKIVKSFDQNMDLKSNLNKNTYV
jgi:hypothetical protein